MKNKIIQKNIPDGWREAKLGDIGKVSMCKRIFKHETSSQGLIPFYKISTFGKTADSFISNDIFERYKKNYPYPQKGEILISASGTIGRTVVFNGEKSYFQDSNIVWISNPQDKVLNIYLKYLYLKTKWKTTDGGIISRLYNDDLRSIKFSLPPLPEQNRIVAVLETWDKAVEDLNKKIEIKKNVKKGLMQELLTGKKRLAGFKDKWEMVKLGDICKIKTGKKDVNEGNPNGKYPFFTCAKDHTFSDNYSFDTEAILIAGNGEVGNCSYYKGKFEAYQRTYVLSDFKYEIFYIYPYLRYYFQNSINSQKQMGAMPYIKLGMLQNFEIKTPPSKEEQTAIANILTTADNEISTLEKKLSILKEQKKYLLNNLITGAIRTPENLVIKK